LFIKSICDAAKALGFNSENTIDIVCKTFIGATNMVLLKEKSLDELIAMVKSPNGTTERALNVFDSTNISKIIFDAMNACAKRAEELSKLN
jgi:pyrroline-5-carboxylate reductase